MPITDFLLAFIVIIVLLLIVTVFNWQFWLVFEPIKDLWGEKSTTANKLLWTVIFLVTISGIIILIDFILNRLF
jgi:hypothetical protein